MSLVIEALRWIAIGVVVLLLIGLAEGIVWCVLLALYRAGRQMRRNRLAREAGWASWQDFERWQGERTRSGEYGRQVKGG